jgi:hypothetical protein
VDPDASAIRDAREYAAQRLLDEWLQKVPPEKFDALYARFKRVVPQAHVIVDEPPSEDCPEGRRLAVIQAQNVPRQHLASLVAYVKHLCA